MTANFIAGGYTASFNAKALGQTAEGYRLDHRFFKRLITGDAEGDTIQDSVYRGRDERISFRLIEALEAGIAEMVEPYAATPGTPGTQGTVGIMDIQNSGGVSTPLALQLILTAIAGTSSATDGPATITFPLVIISEDFPVDVLYASDLREIPFQGRVYADTATGLFHTET